MLNTFIDLKVINEFAKAKPISHENGGDKLENKTWYDFLYYLSAETNLSIYENTIDLPSSQLLKVLTTGRGDSKILRLGKFIKPEGYLFMPKSPHSVFYLDEERDPEKSEYKKRNGYLIAFNDNYLDVYQNLAILKHRQIMSVRKSSENKFFEKWSDMQKYLLPFTDVVFIDNYIMSDESLIYSNLEVIMIELDKASTVEYNFTLITYEGSKYKLSTRETYKKLGAIKQTHKLKAKIGIVMTNFELKQHDRGIFMNYLRIYTGDSFNYFNSKNEIITKGTDIQFQPLRDEDKFDASKDALTDISNTILEIRAKYGEKYFAGSLKNNLLNIS